MKHRLILLVALFLALPFVANAYDFSAPAPSGQTLYYNIFDGNAQVTSDGSTGLNNQDNNYVSGDIVIPSAVTFNDVEYPVTAIAYQAFYCCTHITSVVLPNTLTGIGDQAFYGCHLANIIIPDGVTSIGSYCFSHTRHIEYHGNASWPYYNEYWGAASMNGVTDGDFIYSNEDRTYLYAYIGNDESVTIPSSVTGIGRGAFQYSNLTAVNFHNNITYIGDLAFCCCPNLVSVSIPGSVASIGNHCFQSSGLTSVTFGDGLEYIYEYAFAYCHDLTSVSLPSTLTNIESDAFYECTSLTTLTLPAATTNIGSLAFYECTGLTSISVLAAEPPTLNANVFYDVPTDIPVYVPCGTVATYQAADGWSGFTNIEEAYGCSFTVTLTVNNDAYGTVGGGGTYAPNAMATLTATPATGYYFTQWSDGNVFNPRTMRVTDNITLTAIFAMGDGPSTPSPSVDCGEYQWPAVSLPYPDVQIKQKHDHTSAHTSQGWDTVVSATNPTIELSCTPYIPVQYFNGYYSVDEIPYSPADTNYHLNGQGLKMPLSSDDQFTPDALNLAFPFYFFGQQKTQFRVSDNGMITFCSDFGTYNISPYSVREENYLPWTMSNGRTPTFGGTYFNRMHDAIYGIYEDLYTGYNGSYLSGNNGIYYGVFGEYPARKIIASWDSIPIFHNQTQRHSFQIACYEGTNIIEVHVKSRVGTPATSKSLIGIQNATGEPQVRGAAGTSTMFVEDGAHPAFWPEGCNIFSTDITNKSFRFTPRGVTNASAHWYRVFDDGRPSVELTEDVSDPNGYVIPMDPTSSCPTLTRAVVSPAEPAKYVFELRFRDASDYEYILTDTCVVGTIFPINSSTGVTINADGNAVVVDGANGNLVTLYDAIGTVIDSQRSAVDTPLRFEGLASGTYFVKIGVIPVRMKVVVN